MDAGSFLLLTNLAEIALRALLKDADYNPLDLPPPADEDASLHQASRQAEAAVPHTARYRASTDQLEFPLNHSLSIFARQNSFESTPDFLRKRA